MRIRLIISFHVNICHQYSCNLLFARTPGFCLKTWTDQKEKVFINICKCDQVSGTEINSGKRCCSIIPSPPPPNFTHPRTRSQPLNPSQMSSLLLYWSQVIPHRTECHSASESHTRRRTMVSMAQSLFNNHWRTSLFLLLRVVYVGGGASSLLVSQQDKDGSCNIVTVVLH